MTRKLLWIDLEKGWMCIQNFKNGEHESHEYIELDHDRKGKKEYPKLYEDFRNDMNTSLKVTNPILDDPCQSYCSTND